VARESVHLASQVTPEECRKMVPGSLRMLAELVERRQAALRITCTNMKIMASIKHQRNYP